MDNNQMRIEETAQSMLNGDLEARKKLLNYYTDYVIKIVDTKYKEYNKECLIQAGIIGIEKALNLYSKEHKSYFSEHVCSTIKNYFQTEINKQLNKNKERIKIYIDEILKGNLETKDTLICHYLKYVVKLVETKYSDYNKEDLIQAGMLGVITAINSYNEKTKSSISESVFNSINYYINKQIEYENKYLNINYIGINNKYQKEIDLNDLENLIAIKTELKEYSKKEKQILYLYIYKNYTFEEIGKIYNLSKQRIEKIYKKCTEKIKENLNSEKVNRKK